MATLNTQLRFGRHQQALVEAYKFRTYLQLGGLRSNEAKAAIVRVERVIKSLEGQRLTGIQKMVSSAVRTVRASLNPTDEKFDATSLLDRVDDKEPSTGGSESDGKSKEEPHEDVFHSPSPSPGIKKVIEEQPLGDGDSTIGW
jgi:hypothetical protein